jgi:hypothetical protein
MQHFCQELLFYNVLSYKQIAEAHVNAWPFVPDALSGGWCKSFYIHLLQQRAAQVMKLCSVQPQSAKHTSQLQCGTAQHTTG